MSIRGRKTRGQKRPLTGDNSQPAGDIRTMMRRVLDSRTVVPHEDSQYKLNTQDVAIITMQPHPSILVPPTPMSNLYSRVGNMDRATTSDEQRWSGRYPHTRQAVMWVIHRIYHCRIHRRYHSLIHMRYHHPSRRIYHIPRTLFCQC
jgi:hypothetical protein